MAINRAQRAADRLRARQAYAEHRERQAQINAEAEASGAGGVKINDNRTTERRVLAGKSLGGPAENKSTRTFDATDAAQELADAEGVDLSRVKGSGADGRITKADVEAAVEKQG